MDWYLSYFWNSFSCSRLIEKLCSRCALEWNGPALRYAYFNFIGCSQIVLKIAVAFPHPRQQCIMVFTPPCPYQHLEMLDCSHFCPSDPRLLLYFKCISFAIICHAVCILYWVMLSFIFNWSTVDLQYCVSGVQQSDSVFFILYSIISYNEVLKVIPRATW